MPVQDLVDQFQDRDTRDLNNELALADHNRTWAQSFSSTPPTEVLRANQNYDELLARAADRKLEIAAQTDPHAQQMLYNSRLQPLKEELARGQIEHQAASTLAAGATEKFHRQQDMETMQHVVGWTDYMTKAPAIDSPEYAAYALKGLGKYPRVVGTTIGKEILGNVSQLHDTIQNLKAQIPEGFDIQTIEAAPGKQMHVTAKRSGGDDEKSLRKDYGITPEQFKAPAAVAIVKPDKTGYVGATDGNYVKIDVLGADGSPKSVVMPKADYLKYGGKLAEPATAPSKSGEVKTQAEYDALPPGSEFIFNGKRGKKPAAK